MRHWFIYFIFIITLFVLYIWNPYNLLERYGNSLTIILICLGVLVSAMAVTGGSVSPGVTSPIYCIIAVVVLAAVFYKVGFFKHTDPNATHKSAYTQFAYAGFVILFMLLVVGIMYVGLYGTIYPPPAIVKTLMLVVSLATICIAAYFTGVFTETQTTSAYVINALIITVMLAVLAKGATLGVFGSGPRSGVAKWFMDAVLYLPCASADVAGIAAELAYRVPALRFAMDTSAYVGSCVAMPVVGNVNMSLHTPASRQMYALLLAEAALITGWFTYTMAFRALALRGSVQLQNDPIALTQLTTLGSYEQLNGKVAADKTMEPVYHYGLSFWFFLDAVPPSASAYVPILAYGQTPVVEYNAKTNMMRVSVETPAGSDTSRRVIWHDDAVFLQKWNHMVVNVEGGTMDVFLNNRLVSSNIDVIAYSAFDQLTCGAPNGGVLGQMCNVMYYKHTLTAAKISEIWNEFSDCTPPIVPHNHVFGDAWVVRGQVAHKTRDELHDWYVGGK